MSTLQVRNTYNRGRIGNYLVGGNLCNAFVLGALGSADDFFLVGAEPAGDANYPLLTGSILDAEGKVLCRIVQNMLVENPGNCSKKLGDQIGYEIVDAQGNAILKVATRRENLPGAGGESFVTTLSGNFYNKGKQLVYQAAAGGAEEKLEATLPGAFGFDGRFRAPQNMVDDMLPVAAFMLISKGSVHKLIAGEHTNEDLDLDGVALFNATLKNCKIRLTTGEFLPIGPFTMDSCTLEYRGIAANIRQFLIDFDEGIRARAG